jgi:hypothetical protein
MRRGMYLLYPPLEGEGRIAEGDPGWGALTLGMAKLQ